MITIRVMSKERFGQQYPNYDAAGRLGLIEVEGVWVQTPGSKEISKLCDEERQIKRIESQMAAEQRELKYAHIRRRSPEWIAKAEAQVAFYKKEIKKIEERFYKASPEYAKWREDREVFIWFNNNAVVVYEYDDNDYSYEWDND